MTDGKKKRTFMEVLVLLFSVFLGILVISGCLGEGREPVLGTWEWSDGKGYVERYTFHENGSFKAQALGAAFSGTWKEVSPDHYQVSYTDRSFTGNGETFTDIMLFDHETGSLFFPGHVKV